jgi:transposase-like protein
MQERGVVVDHATVHRWAVKMLPVLAKIFRSRKRSVGRSWRMDETYIKVKGQWKYLYRAVDREGQTIDFLLTAKRDLAAARRFFERAIGQHDLPDSITIDKAAPIPQPSSVSSLTPALTFRCVRTSILTTSLNKTTSH